MMASSGEKGILVIHFRIDSVFIAGGRVGRAGEA